MVKYEQKTKLKLKERKMESNESLTKVLQWILNERVVPMLIDTIEYVPNPHYVQHKQVKKWMGVDTGCGCCGGEIEIPPDILATIKAVKNCCGQEDQSSTVHAGEE